MAYYKVAWVHLVTRLEITANYTIWQGISQVIEFLLFWTSYSSTIYSQSFCFRTELWQSNTTSAMHQYETKSRKKKSISMAAPMRLMLPVCQKCFISGNWTYRHLSRVSRCPREKYKGIVSKYKHNTKRHFGTSGIKHTLELEIGICNLPRSTWFVYCLKSVTFTDLDLFVWNVREKK